MIELSLNIQKTINMMELHNLGLQSSSICTKMSFKVSKVHNENIMNPRHSVESKNRHCAGMEKKKISPLSTMSPVPFDYY